MNNAIPRAEWEESPFTGEAVGPWAKNFTVHLVRAETGAKITSSNATVGQRIAWQTLKEQTSFMRKFRGALVYPEVMLSETSMRSHYGIKMIPHFEIVGWRNFGASPAPVLAPPPVPGTPVAPLTAGEIVDDELPDHPSPKHPSDPIPF